MMGSDPIKPHILLLYGTDEFAISQKVQQMEKDMGDPVTAALNITHLQGMNLTEDAFTMAVNIMPFLSEKRLVILHEPTAAFKAGEGLVKLVKLLEASPGSTSLVLVVELERPIEKDKAFTHWLPALLKGEGLKGKLQTERCDLPDKKKLPGWIVDETIRQVAGINPKIRIEGAAAWKLAEMVGDDTRMAAQEIGKLLEYVNFERNITVEDVELVSIINATAEIFSLTDALGNRDAKRALMLLKQLLLKEEPFAMWAMIINQFRRLLLTREILDEGGNVNDVSDRLHLHPYPAGRLLDQAKHFSLRGLEHIHHRLLELDEKVKTSQLSLELAMELLVVELVE